MIIAYFIHMESFFQNLKTLISPKLKKVKSKVVKTTGSVNCFHLTF